MKENYARLQSYLKVQNAQYEKEKKVRDTFREKYNDAANKKKISHNVQKAIDLDTDASIVVNSNRYAKDMLFSKTDD